jgi:hypothetical protein
MKTLAAAFIFASAILASGSSAGLKPRPSPSDYPNHESGKSATVAATLLTPDQVKSTFSTDMSHYIVVEVGVYPAAGQTVDLSSGDFALRIGAQGEIVRAANPRAIAASIQRKNAPQPSRASDITLYPTATIGVASGTDPMTGRRTRGVYTDTGVGVGIGGGGPMEAPRPASTDRAREVMQQELSDKSLPDGKTADPVAGYLYFPMTPKARNSGLELQYFAVSGKLRVALPALGREH